MTTNVNQRIYQLDTPIGRPFIRALSGGAVGVQGGTPHNTPGGAEGALTINGVEYSVNAAYTLWSDGKFHLGWEGRSNWQELSLRRRDYSLKDPTSAARNKARQVLDDAVNVWVAAHGDELSLGEARKRAEDWATLQRQVEKCEQALLVLRQNLVACSEGGEYSPYPLRQQPEVK